MLQQSVVALVIFVITLNNGFAQIDVFTVNQIVPDVIDVPPSELVEIIYPSGGVVKLGNYLTPSQVLQKPNVKFNGDPTKYYLLAMTDPDVPSRVNPTGEFKHWLVGNIPGQNVCNGETLAGYIPSAPPEGSEYHRYTFLIYEQPGYIQFNEPRVSNSSTAGRFQFSIRNFAAKYHLGEAIFGNFYQAEYDNSVPITLSMLDME